MNQTQDDTNELLRRAGANDPIATEQLLMRHRDRLRRMVSLRLDQRISPRIDASDIVQEVLIKASYTLPEYLTTKPMEFYPWLRRLAWEVMVDNYRAHFVAARRSVNREQDINIPLPNESTVLLADVLVANQSSPSKQLERDEMKKEIHTSLKLLSPQYQEVLTLRYLEQLTVKEIADETESTEAAVKMRHMRAMQQLAKFLSRFHSSND